jgi:hypothetical protein
MKRKMKKEIKVELILVYIPKHEFDEKKEEIQKAGSMPAFPRNQMVEVVKSRQSLEVFKPIHLKNYR